MNKEEIQKRIVEVKTVINDIISKARILSVEEMNTLELSYSEMESLQFQLRSLEDGTE